MNLRLTQSTNFELNDPEKYAAEENWQPLFDFEGVKMLEQTNLCRQL